MEPINWEIPRISDNPLPITLKKGDQLFIVGANGSGKSALMQRFASDCPHAQVKRISAHRRTWFNSGSIEFTPAHRQQYDKQTPNYDTQPDSRWRDFRPGEDLSAVLFDLVAKDNAQARKIRDSVNTTDVADLVNVKKFSVNSPSPFNQINDLLSRATLTVTLENPDDRELLARHSQGSPFSIAKMSDGERNAMIIAAQVITAEPETLFLIDEPERHLHRSIIEPFLSELFVLRTDCAFIISTHEIALPVANPAARVLMLRSCRWDGDYCEAWDVEVLEPDTQLPEERKLPEDLKLAILGSRKRILFVEGSSSSLDYQLYTALFPGISVVPKGSCEEVQKAVLGLRESHDNHHVDAFGLIDRDNRSDEEVERLAKKGVFALDVWSVESLYYCSEAIAAVAHRRAESMEADSNEFVKSAEQKAIEKLKGKAEHMVARRCERQIRERLLAKVPNLKKIQDNPVQSICVSVDSPYCQELKRYNNLVEEGKWDKLVARYPLRETGVFGIIATNLRCCDRSDYEKMVIARIRNDEELAKALKNRLGPLAKRLDQA